MQGSVESLLSRFDAKRVAADTRALSAPAMAGRIAGSEGEQRAGGHVARALGEAGLEPLRELGGLFDPFDLVVADLTALPSLAVTTGGGRRSFVYLEDYCVNVQGAAGGGTR